MKIGFDYWQVLSHFPEKVQNMMASFDDSGDEIHVISAIGKNRVGTVAGETQALVPWLPEKRIHEVVFEKAHQSPELKLAKCKELGIEVFFDDRDDVCRLLNQNGIMAMRVTRKDNSTYDLGAEREG